MSQFEIKCPHCGIALSIQEEWIGMILECPECKQNFSVRESPDEAPSTEQKPSGGNELSEGGQHDEFGDETPLTEQNPSGGNEPSDDTQHGEFREENPSAEQKNAGGNEPIDDTQRGESCEKNPSTEQKTSGGNELSDDGQHGEFCDETPATEQKTSGGNELSDDTQHGEFSEDNPPQKGKNQPMQNQSETQPVNSRKSRRLIFLIAGSLILLAAVSVSVICSLKVSSAIADGRHLLSDPNKFPDTSALKEAKVKLDKVNSKYWFAFARWRTEGLRNQLEAARIVVSVIDEGESILRSRQYGKFQKTIDKLKQTSAKYPFTFAKRRTENLLDQLNQFQQIIARKISEGLEKLKAAQTAEEMLQIYRSIIASCPANAPELKPVWKSYRNASSQYVNRMIELAEKSNKYNDALTYLKRAMNNCPDGPNIDNARNLYYQYLREYVNRLIEAAKKSDNYNDALRYLKDALNHYPDAPNINIARNLYYQYLREIEQKRQAQRARQNQMQTCPACRGTGQVSQTGFTPGQYQAAILGTTTCSTCSGTGAVRRNANVRVCPACGGRKSTRDIFTGRSMQCRNCDGSGYVTFSD